MRKTRISKKNTAENKYVEFGDGQIGVFFDGTRSKDELEFHEGREPGNVLQHMGKGDPFMGLSLFDADVQTTGKNRLADKKVDHLVPVVAELEAFRRVNHRLQQVGMDADEVLEDDEGAVDDVGGRRRVPISQCIGRPQDDLLA